MCLHFIKSIYTISISTKYENTINKAGFTLVELIIVIIVIAILATLVVIGYNTVQTKAVETSLKSDLDSASGAIESYKQQAKTNYPADPSVIDGGKGISKSGSNSIAYVTDGSSYCITATSPKTQNVYHYLSTIGKIADGPCGDLENQVAENVTTIATGLDYPTGIAINSTEFIYVTETNKNRILKIMSDGTSTIFAGSTTGVAGFVNGNGTTARFNKPYGLGVDAAGNVYVAEIGNDVFRKITPSGDVSTFAGSGSSGSNNGVGTSASFFDPFAISVDPASNEIYITETGNHRVRKITSDGTASFVAGSSAGYLNGTGSSAKFNDPLGIGFQGSLIYVAEYSNNTIRSITRSGIVKTVYGSQSAGFVDADGQNARFNRPSGLAVKGNTLYVADSGNHRIRTINLTTTAVKTYAGSGTNGSSDSSSSNAQFSFPTGLAVSPNGTVYVVESDAGRIRKIQ